MESWESSTIDFDGKVVRLRVGTVRLDDGSQAYREVIEHPGGVCILPFDGVYFHFVRQFRIALNRYLLEAPAGKLEPGESPGACARKELKEESGHEAGTLVPLGHVFSSVGFCNERIHLFLALDLVHSGTAMEPEERIEQVPLTVKETIACLNSLQFDDAKTEVVIRRAIDHLQLRH